jgi:putative flippase GtrA
VAELPIETVYIDDNASSHFRPFFDSLVIYSLLLRFSFSSLAASIIDTAIFYVMILHGTSLSGSVVTARILSSMVNFTINRDFVFRSDVSLPKALAKYYALVVFIGTLSYLSIDFLHGTLHVDLIAAKIASEAVLYLVSFLVQRDLIFTTGRERR